MKTVQEIAQWVIDNRYPKSEKEKVSDFEMFLTLTEAMNKLFQQKQINEPPFFYCAECNGIDSHRKNCSEFIR